MIVVTGASGLLGAGLVSAGRKLDRPVTALCHRHLLQVPGVPAHSLNLTLEHETRALLRQLQPRSIIHCAAATSVEWCEQHPETAEQINVRASGFLAELAQELGSQFIYVSTDSVFDGEQGDYCETDTPAPLNVYAKTKLRGEEEVLRRHSSPLIVRANMYGWNAQPKQSLAEGFLDALRTGKPMPGFTDVYFCPILANDLADVLLTMLDARLHGIYNVVGAEKVSKYEFAVCLAKKFDLAPDFIVPMTVAESKLRVFRPRDVSLSTKKVQTALGRRMPDVDAGLRRFRTLHDNGYPQQLKDCLPGAGE